MKTVLIPTDFKPASLKVIDALLFNRPGERFNIVLFHAFKISDSITDLLMLNRRSKDYDQISDEFYFLLEDYQQRYRQLSGKISISYYYGTTVASFRNFAENLDTDFIAFAPDYPFQVINKRSFEPTRLIQRSGYHVEEVDHETFQAPENLFESKIPVSLKIELVKI